MTFSREDDETATSRLLLSENGFSMYYYLSFKLGTTCGMCY